MDCVSGTIREALQTKDYLGNIDLMTLVNQNQYHQCHQIYVTQVLLIPKRHCS